MNYTRILLKWEMTGSIKVKRVHVINPLPLTSDPPHPPNQILPIVICYKLLGIFNIRALAGFKTPKIKKPWGPLTRTLVCSALGSDVGMFCIGVLRPMETTTCILEFMPRGIPPLS